MTMITPSYLGETIEYSSLHACRSTLEDPTIRGFDAATLAKVAEYSVLPGKFQGGVAVMPGHPETLAAYYLPDEFHGTHLAIFDAGIMRPNEPNYSSGSDARTGLLFSEDGRFLFSGSFANSNVSGSTTRYAVDSSGIPAQTSVMASGGGPITISGGVLYTSLGTLIDPQSMNEIGFLGMTGPIAIDGANDRILEVHYQPASNASSYPEVLQAFDLATQQPLGSMGIGGVNYFDAAVGASGNLFRFGRDGLVWSGPYGILVFHTPLAGPAPSIDANGVVNTASLQGGPIAPGEALTIKGTNLGPNRVQATEPSVFGVLPTAINNVQVWFGNRAGTLLMTSENQLNVIAPFELNPGTNTNLQVWYYGIPSAKIGLPVAAAAPALFTRNGSGTGSVVAMDSNGYSVGGARTGGTITLFGTGGGRIAAGSAGSIARSLSPLAGSTQVTLAGQAATVVSAGSMPGLPNGIFQLVVQIPPGLAAGPQPVTVKINGQSSPKGATLAIH